MTVLDLRSVFSLPPVEREGPNAFIAVPSGEPGKLTALWVDSVVEMVTVPFAEMKPLTSPVAGIPEGILASMFIRGEEAIFLLNLERVLSGPGKSGEEAPALNSLAV
jgi:chemotaxis signal transduction protein